MRGNAATTKVHYQGKDEDFIVFVENAADVAKWKEDRTIPLAQVVDSFKIFVTHKHGAQGVMDGASKSTLENEFGTHKDDDVIIKILEQGTIQESENPGRGGDRNLANGGKSAR